jgi:curli biogenesis system outer membrane secretion channel CsgG
MKKLAFLALALLFCTAARPYRFTNFTVNRAALGSIRTNRVAVLPLAGTDGARMADEFSIQLGKLGTFDIVERQRITDLYREQDLDPDRIDQSTAVEVGKMLGAHAVVMGTVLDYRAGRVGANLRLVGVETGEVVWQGSDNLDGRDARVQALVTDREDKARLTGDSQYLAMWLCRLLAETVR